MSPSSACRETLKTSAKVIKSKVKRVTTDSLLLLTMKLSSDLLRNYNGKVVVVKATNTSFPKDFRSWLRKECRHVTVDLLSCCDLRWWKLLPPSLLQRLVKEGGGRFRCTTGYGLDNILNMAFGFGTEEVYDARVQFICNPEFHFVSAHGYGVSDVVVHDNGQKLTCRVKRLQEGEHVGVVMKPRQEMFTELNHNLCLQAKTTCRLTDGQKLVMVSTSQIKYSSSPLPDGAILKLLNDL